MTMDDDRHVFSPGIVVYDETAIRYVGDPSGFHQRAEQTVSFATGIIMPGLLNGHNHAAMSLMRGMADDSPFFEWLTQHVWPVENHLTAQDIHIGSLLAIAEMLHSGTVGFADMYFHVDETARAVDEAGMRAWVARGLVGLEDETGEKLAEAVEFCRHWQGRGEGRVVPMLGPHAPYTCPPDYLGQVAEHARQLGVGIHIHLSESRDEMAQMGERYGKTPIQIAYDAGLFTVRTLIAHGVHIKPDDLPYLEGLTGGVVSCPVSNAKLGNGIMPYNLLRDAQITVGLGTDGATSTNTLDMFLEMKAMAWFQKLREEKPEAFHAYDALWAATRGTAEILGHPGGQLAPGRPADFIVVESNSAALTPQWDPIGNLVYGASGSDVRYVVIGGKTVLQEGIITTFDEQSVLTEARTRKARLMEASK